KGVELANLGGGEEHCAGVWTGGHTGTTADTLGGVHGGVCRLLADGDGVGILGGTGTHADETTCLHDAVESATINCKVLDYRECLGTERFDPDDVAIVELAHVKLAGRGGAFRTVWVAVDHQRAHATDAFAAVMVECNGIATSADDAFVDDIKHL